MKVLFNLSEIILTKKNVKQREAQQQKAEAQFQEQYDKLQKIMDNYQKHAKVRTLNADEVISLIELIERRNSELPKYLVYGSTYCIQPHAETFCSTYNGIPESTAITIEITKKGMLLTNVCRRNCNHARSYIATYKDPLAVKERLYTNFVY
jgi:hypothetical protein